MEKLELERKWLVLDSFSIPAEIKPTKIDITQLYLISDKKERLRISTCVGERKFTHTIKRPAEGGGNWELEKEISSEEYINLVWRVDKDCSIIIKERNVFWMNNLKYELDIFVHPIKITILEVEVAALDRKVELPDWLGKLYEVTNIKGFSNKRIASNHEFTMKKVEEIRFRK